MRWCWKKERVIETRRQVRANDPTFNSSFNYRNNYISTSKYNVITFLPKNLFEQFQRLANAYFLFLLVLQFIPQVTSLSPVTTVIPLVFVLAFTALKDLFDDILIPWISSLSPITTIVPLVAVLAISAIKDAADDVQRHRSDNQVNNRLSWVLRDGKLTEEKWHTVMVGDIIKMKNDQFVAADLLLLSASEPNSLCYIETAELDGETNLKVKQALTETAELEDNIEAFAAFNGEVQCEPPNNILSKFEGTLTWNGQRYSLDNERILLRGCILRNTEWCYGLVLFAGKDSKVMMNTGKSKFKQTHIDVLMNYLIIGIFVFLCCMCAVCSILCGIWESIVGTKFQVFLPWDSYVPGSWQLSNPSSSQIPGGAAVIAILVFFSYIIVLNTVVPISLYVSVEMIRFGHSLWINFDSQMYYEKTGTFANSRTTTLNEELGQIEYIFSDKTGTLTQNVMTFNKCSIEGVSYGDYVDPSGRVSDVTDKTPRIDFSSNPYFEKAFDFYDRRLLEGVNAKDEQVHMFFRLLALCHTIMPTEKDGVLEYQAQSPDEAALVGAARNFGFVFKSRTPNTIKIEVLGEEEEYELLAILDFNNVRKRMSVVLRHEGKIKLYCKGADSTINERLHESSAHMRDITNTHLETFSQDGLRTLCCSVKDIDPAYFVEWKKKHHEASTSLENRDEKLDEVYEEIEQGMTLIAATAIEDKLQDGVPECIANLARADIKIWVLTGDKQETAVNIGYSCKLLTEEMVNIFVVDGETADVVRQQLSEAHTDMMNRLSGDTISPSYSSNKNNVANGTPNGFATIAQPHPSGGFAIIINGHSLVHALTKDMEKLLLDTGCLCKAVICCRVTPLQKALVVKLVKEHKKTITLAIGDGANDVSMIKMAHIGIGISGQEGMQAVLASDYSIAQFRYLERLLLVHGRWSYLRMCKFLKYFFYKNFAFTLCHFWFAFFCGFSAQTLYDPYFITFYNVFYTSLPVMALGLFDQDVMEEYSLRFPRLYTPGHLDLLFNKKVFAQSVAEGVISSIVLFFIPYGSFQEAIRPDGTDISGYRSFGTMVASCLVITVTLRCGLETSYWTGFNHLVIWGSIAFYYVFTCLFYLDAFDYLYSGTAVQLFATANYWFTLLLTVVILLIPTIAERFYYIDTRPTLTDKVRMKQKVGQLKARSGVRILRRASSTRRSNRSVGRSGYAFSHQEGFGERIMNGTMLRGSTRSVQSKSLAALPNDTVKNGGLAAQLNQLPTVIGATAGAARPSSAPVQRLFDPQEERVMLDQGHVNESMTLEEASDFSR